MGRSQLESSKRMSGGDGRLPITGGESSVERLFFTGLKPYVRHRKMGLPAVVDNQLTQESISKEAILLPAYDSNNQLILWVDLKKGNVFDTQMNWVAYVSQGNLFSAARNSWLGPIRGSSLQDRQGRAVAWMPKLGAPTSGMAPLQPLTPLKPLMPLRPLVPLLPLAPLRPLAPMGGWSATHPIAWLNS
ncbi:4-fold beta flower protein [Burkholderia gladioli]|uniref:4-fold beta flower protein n=1 Tax=Burkholderia gladioli TaxID=28095 RepID=UPI003A5BA854